MLAAGWALGVTPADAQDVSYPAKDIKVLCNFPAGTNSDIFVRFYAERLSALTGRNVITENRGNASGNDANQRAVKAKADGYTILITPASSTLATAAHTFKKLGYDPRTDLAPVTTLSKMSFVVLNDPKSPVKSIADLTAAMKAKAGKGAYGATSNTGLIVAELYNKLAATGANRVQFKDNASMLSNLFSSQIDFVAIDVPWASEQVKSGRLRALAVTGKERSASLPDVPTFEQAGVKGYGSIEPWWGVFVPAKTPQPIVDKLEGYFNRIVASEEAKKFLSNLGSDPYPGNAKMLRDHLASEFTRWGELVKFAGIQPQ